MKTRIKHTLYSSTVSVLLLTSGNSAFTASAAHDGLAVKAQKAIEVLQKADSRLTNLFNDAVGYAVFPSVGKGGVFFGGEHGKGIVYEKGKPIGEATLTEINVASPIGLPFSYTIPFPCSPPKNTPPLPTLGNTAYPTASLKRFVNLESAFWRTSIAFCAF